MKNVIDIHTHLGWHKIYARKFLEGIVEGMAPDLENREMVMRMVLGALMDEGGSKFIAQLEQAGIERAVLLIADFGYSLGEAELSIEEIHAVHRGVLRAFPGRLEVFAGVDPRRGRRGWDLLERSLGEYGFSGLKLYPPCGFELDDESAYPLYEICADYGVPVLTHTGASIRTMEVDRRYPESLLKVAAEFKDVPFILGHAGARDPERAIALAKTQENVYFDISTFQNAWSLDELPRRLRSFLDAVPDRVIFGSDWPMFSLSGTQKKWVDLIVQAGRLSESELEKLFHTNARGVLPEKAVAQ